MEKEYYLYRSYGGTNDSAFYISELCYWDAIASGTKEACEAAKRLMETSNG